LCRITQAYIMLITSACFHNRAGRRTICGVVYSGDGDKWLEASKWNTWYWCLHFIVERSRPHAVRLHIPKRTFRIKLNNTIGAHAHIVHTELTIHLSHEEKIETDNLKLKLTIMWMAHMTI
jgi:hypothetical protein